MNVIVWGVSGTGKTTIGTLLAEQLQRPFFDADNFHSEANKRKMQGGIALNDDDRWPWLETLAQQLQQWEADGGAVLACSALKTRYRDVLASRCRRPLAWCQLHGSRELLTRRLGGRRGHYFNPALLDSQLQALESPGPGWVFDVQLPPEDIVAGMLARLKQQQIDR